MRYTVLLPWVGGNSLRRRSEFGEPPLGGVPDVASRAAARMAGDGPVPEAGDADSTRHKVREKARQILRGNVDPLRLVVWSLFGVLVIAIWAAIIWFVWHAG